MGRVAREVLRDRDAGLYLSAVVVSGFGTSAMWLAAGVWVKSLTGSDSLAALTAFAMWAPSLLGPLLGAVADRFRRRPLLAWSNLAMSVLLLPLLAVDSAGRVWILYAVLAVYGAVSVVQDAAEAGLVAKVVDARLLGDVNGLRMAANEGMKLLAPLVGVVLLTRFGGASVALLDIASFAAAAAVFALLRVREERPAARPKGAGGLSEVSAGARELWRSPVLRPLVAGGAATMALAGVNGALVYAVTDSVLDRSPAFTGVLYAAQGAGSVLCGLLAGPLLRRAGERRVAAAGVTLFAVAVALRALPYDAVALVCSAGIGLGLPCVLLAAATAVQRETPDAVLGRTAATASTLMFLPNAVTLALGAALAAFADVRLLLPLTGALGLVVAGLLARPGRAPEASRRRRP